MYDHRDERILLSIAQWLRLLGEDYGATGRLRFERMASMVERHNKRMAEKRAMAVPSKPPERRAA